jgi:hypothetical protein
MDAPQAARQLTRTFNSLKMYVDDSDFSSSSQLIKSNCLNFIRISLPFCSHSVTEGDRPVTPTRPFIDAPHRI